MKFTALTWIKKYGRLQRAIGLGVALISLCGCQSFPGSSADEKEDSGPASAICQKYGDEKHFNQQRIKAFQQLIQNQVSLVKSAPVSEASTSLLAQLEILRRRSSHPFLQAELKPEMTTRAIQRESENLIRVLESQAPKNPNTTNTVQYLRKNFLVNLENRDEWNCLQKQGQPVPHGTGP